MSVRAELNALVATRGAPCCHVAWLIAEHQGGGQVDPELARGLKQHARSGLATAAILAVAVECLFRMMRAEVDTRERRACFSKARLHPVRQTDEGGLVVVASANARLIGYNDERVSRFMQSSSSLKDARHPFEIFDLVHVGAVDVNHAIAVYKCSFNHWYQIPQNIQLLTYQTCQQQFLLLC